MKTQENSYQKASLFGMPVLFTEARIQITPKGFHKYELKGRDDKPEVPATVEYFAVQNFVGTVLLDQKLPLSFRGLWIGTSLELGCEKESPHDYLLDRHFHPSPDLHTPSVMNRILLENEKLLMNERKVADEKLWLSGSVERELDGLFGIYQINEESPGRKYLFQDKKDIDRLGLSVKGSHYDLIYAGSSKLRSGIYLSSEDLSHAFTFPPDGFVGRDLSVSDVILLNQKGKTEAYYIDSDGFPKLPDFANERKEVLEVIQ